METKAICMLMLTGVLSLSSGLPVRYDQRQEGDLNVHAHLENFIIVLIPNSSELSLLDLVALKKNANRHTAKPSSSAEGDGDVGKYVAPSTAVKSSSPDFPAGKSPYKVDVDLKMESTVSGEPVPAGQEVIIAHSTSTLASKTTTAAFTALPKEETPVTPTVEASSENSEKEETNSGAEDKTDAPTTEKVEDSKKEEVEVPVVNAKPEKPGKSPKSIDFGIEVPLVGIRRVSGDDVPEIDFSQTLRSKSEADELEFKRKFLSSGLHSAGQARRGSVDDLANRLKSLRSGMQECAPEQRRDNFGNCVYSKARSLIAALQTGLSPADS